MRAKPIDITISRTSSATRFTRGLLAFAAVLMLAGANPATAQQPVLNQGNAVVTGFSGVAANPAAPPSADPMDGLFIDPNGASARILDLSTGGQSPQGQLIASPSVFQAKAAEVGQVFGIALDDGRGPDGNLVGVPDIYLTGTSVFGLQLVAPDASGALKRIKVGQSGAQWMPGQWGNAAKSATPGSIWKVNGTTGEISLFANVLLAGQPNSGAGLGNIAFDARTRQLFVSDLETGMIHRFDMHGVDLGYFDHGTVGRTANGLPPVAYDATGRVKIETPAFSTEDASTWHYAQKGRMVWGLRVLGDRLYYATADGPQVWSIAIGVDGSFGTDPHMEIDVKDTPKGNAISDITFDGQGYIYLAQRGASHGDYSYQIFAEPKTSALVRFHRDPVSGLWVPPQEEYAVGFPPEHHNTNGGVALGYAYDQQGNIARGSCGRMVWTTGEQLRVGSGLPGPADVHGLQGMERSLVRPANVPPKQTYFADYDGTGFDVPNLSGQIGDVEIWQPCEGGIGFYFQPPAYQPPPTGTFNLTLNKIADPKDCVATATGYSCTYRIFVSNTGSTIYAGPLNVDDWLPAAPAGAVMTFSPQPPWSCAAFGPSAYSCNNPFVVLYPGQWTEIDVKVDLPASYAECSLDNVAEIEWWPGYGDANPADDAAIASARIPNRLCLPPTGKKTNLLIRKIAKPKCDQLGTGDWLCKYAVLITNTGPGVYNDKIEFTDTPAPGTTAAFLGPFPWVCAGGPPTYTCKLPVTSLNPGQTVGTLVLVKVPGGSVKRGQCEVPNKAHITYAPGGSDENTNPGDDDASASAKIPSEQCIGKKTDLTIKKELIKCDRVMTNQYPGTDWACVYKVTVTNVGPGVYNGSIVVDDVVSSPTTAMATLPVGLCTGTGPFTCTIPSASLNPGQSTGFLIAVGVSNAQSVRNQCKLRNDVKIAQAPGGSPMNSDPSNDSSSATGIIPNPRCNDQPPPPSTPPHVKIEKTCKPLAATAGLQCRITVTNDGGVPIPGNVTFGDQGQWTGNGTPMSISSATPDSSAVSCSGLPNNLMCTVAGSDLAPGTSHWVDVTIAGQQGQSAYKNCAAIMQPGVKTFVAAGQQSCVTGGGEITVHKTAPATCTYGQPCTFQVTITNNSDTAFSGPLMLGDQLYLTGASGATITSISPSLGCSPNPTHLPFSCTANVSLAAHESHTHSITVQMPNAPVTIAAVSGGTNCFVATPGQGAGNGIKPLAAPPKGDGPGYSCVTFAMQSPKPETCPGDLVRQGTQCVCPEGTTLTAGYHCRKTGGHTPPTTQHCEAPLVGDYPNCHCPDGKVLDNNGRCVKPPKTCKTGLHLVNGECVPDQPVCTGGHVPFNGDCICPRGTVENADHRCVPKPIDCKKGSHFSNGECVPDTPTCTGGHVPFNGDCICPKGTIEDANHRCVSRIIDCKKGFHPSNGECVPDRLVCTGGHVPSSGQCVCPKGTTDVNGVCQQQTQQCKGVMLNGVCIPLGGVGKQPKACPAPATGTLPNCTCPKGMKWSGKRCVPLDNKPPILQQPGNGQIFKLPKGINPKVLIPQPSGPIIN